MLWKEQGSALVGITRALGLDLGSLHCSCTREAACYLKQGSGVLLVASDLQKPKAEPSTPNRLGLDKTAELIRD